MASKDEIVRIAADTAFGNPVMNNVMRAIVVEAIVSSALTADWQWCSADWALCDFRHADGTRLEVKQSASRQSWHTAGCKPSRAVFDIATRTQAWDGKRWVASTGRNADIYVFAHHPVVGPECDHREPGQWRFHVIPAAALPAGRTISLSAISRLGEVVKFEGLAEAVEGARLALDGSDERFSRSNR
ncbi:MAG: hypothetical protein ACXIVF_18665 [Rhizobiaceae bacterium]